MKKRWITLAAKDIHVILPLGIFDKDIEIIFKTPEAIDSAIEQLQQMKIDISKLKEDDT